MKIHNTNVLQNSNPSYHRVNFLLNFSRKKMLSYIRKIFQRKNLNARKVEVNNETIEVNLIILGRMIEFLNLLESSLELTKNQDRNFFVKSERCLKIFKSCSLKYLQVLNKEILEVQKLVDLKQEFLMSLMENKMEFGSDLADSMRKLMNEMERLCLFDETDFAGGDTNGEMVLNSYMFKANRALKFQVTKLDLIIEAMQKECTRIVEGFETGRNIFE